EQSHRRRWHAHPSRRQPQRPPHDGSAPHFPAHQALTCASHALHVQHMSKMIQIRHVPDQLHRRLRTRAALAGMTLTDYLRQELERVADQLTYAELRERLRAAGGGPVRVSESPAKAVR